MKNRELAAKLMEQPENETYIPDQGQGGFVDIGEIEHVPAEGNELAFTIIYPAQQE